MRPPDYTFQQLSDNPSNIPGDILFSTLSWWFAAAGNSVTFTATPPPGTSPLRSLPQIYGGFLTPPTPPPNPNPGPPLHPRPPSAPRLPSPPRTPSRPQSPPSPPQGQVVPLDNGSAQSMDGWKIGLVVGLVVGVSLLLGLVLGLMWKRRFGCWGRKDGGKYAIKVRQGFCTHPKRAFTTSPDRTLSTPPPAPYLTGLTAG